MGQVRMTRPVPSTTGPKPQLDLLPSAPVAPPNGLVPLDRRSRGTEFLAVQVRSVLNSPAATHMPFWSLNPYVGCEFGCTYCYLVERMGGEVETLPAWEAFERRVIVKPDIADVLARTLEPARLAGSSLVIGTATDPYQPAERKFRLTRRVLEALLAYRGLSLGLITKSPLVTRDLVVLRQLSERHQFEVNISLATLDARLARRLELRSPVPAARLRALAKLTGAGIRAGLLIAPIVPCVTDSRAALDALFQAAREAGAHYVVGSALRLGPAARHRFLPHLAREFPERAGQMGKEAVPRCGAEAERRPDHVVGTGLPRRLEERVERGAAVGDARNDGRNQQTGSDAGAGQFGEGAEARRRHWRAELEPPGQPGVQCCQRDVHFELVTLGQLAQHDEIAGDQRRLGDEAEGEPAIGQQRLEHSTGEPELSLGGLIRIGGGPDDERRACQPGGLESSREHVGDIGLHDDSALERFPGRQGLNFTAHALDQIAVGVAGIAVGAAELAADVRIERPERHVGGRWRIEHRAHLHGEELGAPRSSIERHEPVWRCDRRRGEQVELRLGAGGAGDRPSHPHLPHPH